MEHNCWDCGEVMEEKEIDFKGTIKEEEFEFKTIGLICPNGHKSLLGLHMDAHNIKLADAYRKKHGLLSTDELLNYRKKFGMSQQEFADFLDTHVQSIKRWEHGCIQDKAMDSLIRLKIEKLCYETGIILEEESHFQMKEQHDESLSIAA